MKAIVLNLTSPNQSVFNSGLLLLESIFKYGELDDAQSFSQNSHEHTVCEMGLDSSGNSTQIYIYINPRFLNLMKSSILYSRNRMILEPSENLNYTDYKDFRDYFIKTVSLSDQFSKYNTIIYLGCSNLVIGSVQKLFNFINSQDDTNNSIYTYITDNKTNCAIVGFKNTVEFRGTASNNLVEIQTKPIPDYIINSNQLNLSKYELYIDLKDKYVIVSFDGIPGDELSINQVMNTCLMNINEYNIARHINYCKEYITQYLMPIIRDANELLEGNLFTYHDRYPAFTNKFLHKQKNICNLMMNREYTNLMEIGFNAGFSALLILVANPSAKLMCFDLGIHKYTYPCFLKLRETFGDRVSIILGDSTQTVPLHEGCYDFIHIDGGHTAYVANSDISHSYRLIRPGGILIMDDVDSPVLNKVWYEYVNKFRFLEIDTYKYKTPHHDIRTVPSKD